MEVSKKRELLELTDKLVIRTGDVTAEELVKYLARLQEFIPCVTGGTVQVEYKIAGDE